MEVLGVVRILWRRRLAVAVGLVVAAGLGLMSGGTDPTSTGVAATRVTLDTPRSQLVDVAPAGADTLAWRAGLLTHLAATEPVRRRIARRLGIRVDRLALVDPSVASPVVEASLPKAAAEVAALDNATPYVLTMSLADGALPIISVEAQALDRTRAVRLARAGASLLESERSSGAGARRQPFVVQRIAPIHAKTVVSNRGPVKSIAVSVFLFGLWCAGVALGPLLLGRLPRLGRRIERS
jgi:hypothetical protein